MNIIDKIINHWDRYAHIEGELTLNEQDIKELRTLQLQYPTDELRVFRCERCGAEYRYIRPLRIG